MSSMEQKISYGSYAPATYVQSFLTAGITPIESLGLSTVVWCIPRGLRMLADKASW